MSSDAETIYERVAKLEEYDIIYERDKICFMTAQSLTTSTSDVQEPVRNSKRLDIFKLTSLTKNERIAYTDREVPHDSSVQDFVKKFQQRWVSVTPGIPSIAYHIVESKDSCIDLSIVDNDRVA